MRSFSVLLLPCNSIQTCTSGPRHTCETFSEQEHLRGKWSRSVDLHIKFPSPLNISSLTRDVVQRHTLERLHHCCRYLVSDFYIIYDPNCPRKERSNPQIKAAVYKSSRTQP